MARSLFWKFFNQIHELLIEVDAIEDEYYAGWQDDETNRLRKCAQAVRDGYKSIQKITTVYSTEESVLKDFVCCEDCNKFFIAQEEAGPIYLCPKCEKNSPDFEREILKAISGDCSFDFPIQSTWVRPQFTMKILEIEEQLSRLPEVEEQIVRAELAEALSGTNHGKIFEDDGSEFRL